jgi:predicted metal-binding membrane protein
LSEGAELDKPAAPIVALLRGFNRAESLSVVAILLVAAVAWGYIATLPPMSGQSADMPGMDMGGGLGGATWTWARASATFGMWSIMMVAMMLPAAAPIVLLHRRTASQGRAEATPAPPTALLVLGYTIVWTAFASVATGLQWLLSEAGLLTTSDALSHKGAAGAVLIAAGLYQLTPFKQTCLRLCRSPVAFLMRHYRPGGANAVRMGLVHGLYCLGCCWAAMALLFVGGVMNLVWVAGLAIFVLVEKTLPFARAFSAVVGLTATAVGLYWLVSSMFGLSI